jgi:hypothetical protein
MQEQWPFQLQQGHQASSQPNETCPRFLSRLKLQTRIAGKWDITASTYNIRAKFNQPKAKLSP